MDPNTGRLYLSIEEARLAGVKKPVEIIGTRSQAERISHAVKGVYKGEQQAKKEVKRKKAAKAARKASRHG